MATSTKLPGKRATPKSRDRKKRFQQGDSQADISRPSKSSLKNRPEPRGIREKTSAALDRRLEEYVPNMPSGQSCRRPGSQNRKKGCSL